MTSDPVADGDKEIFCGHGAVEYSVGIWGYVAIVTIIRGPAEKIIRTTLLRPSF